MLIIKERTIDPEVTVLEATGRITLGRNAQELEWKINDLLQRPPVRIVLDLSNVDHLDSTGIGIIVMAAGRANGRGGFLRIAGAKGAVEHTLQLCKVSDMVPFHADAAQAAAAIGAVAGKA